MRVTQVELGNIFKLPNPGLRAYLQHVEHGNQEIYRPPFWKGKDPEFVMTAWQHILDRSDVKRKWPSLYAFEMDMKSKVGPMSLMKPLKDRIPDIKDYYTLGSKQGEPIAEEAIHELLHEFSGVAGLTPKEQRAVIQDMRLSTNSGNPYFEKRRNVIQETTPVEITQQQGRFQQLLGNSKQSWPCAAVLGWRGQEGGPSADDVKQRTVWMFPFGVNVAELTVYQPFIEAVQRLNLIPAYVSMDAVDECVTNLFHTKASDDVVVCTDFSKFDQHFNPALQRVASTFFEKTLVNSSISQNWIEHVFPLKYQIPLVAGELLFTGDHGMGSGSGGTNADECIAHRALQHEVALEAGESLNRYSMAYGDDGILSYPGIEVDDVIRSYTRHGLDMNPDKQYVSTQDCVVLRRWHSTDYTDERGRMIGVYSTFRALGRLLYQERFYNPETWSAKMVTLRAWSIIENCRNSPLFEDFVEFVLKGDKYKLGLLIPGFISNIESEIDKAIDAEPDMLGYTKTLQRAGGAAPGVKAWRVYQYLVSRKSRA